MVLTAYHFDGNPQELLEGHRKMAAMYPPGTLDFHAAVETDKGIVVFDACPDRATQKAFEASPEFQGTLQQLGLPVPRSEVLGDIRFAVMTENATR